MAASGHSINGKGSTHICRKCGLFGDTPSDNVFNSRCPADDPKNQPHPSHKMKYSPNKNRPFSNDIRTCTKCERMSLQVNDFFYKPCDR
jgi:hypothetical protein